MKKKITLLVVLGILAIININVVADQDCKVPTTLDSDCLPRPDFEVETACETSVLNSNSQCLEPGGDGTDSDPNAVSITCTKDGKLIKNITVEKDMDCKKGAPTDCCRTKENPNCKKTEYSVQCTSETVPYVCITRIEQGQTQASTTINIKRCVSHSTVQPTYEKGGTIATNCAQ